MAVVNPDKTTWTKVSGPGILQVQAGRIKLATSATPAEGDYLALRVGDTIEVTADIWVQAIDLPNTVVLLMV